MNEQHKNLAAGKWNSLAFFEQMANVGSEVERAIIWREKGTCKFLTTSHFFPLKSAGRQHEQC
jgi:hypothetical protein